MLSPSMMCCDFIDLGKQLRSFEKGGVDLLHIDVMDGSFVPNFALGTDYVRQLRRVTDIPLDIHFMTECPERHIDAFPIGEEDYVSIHFESVRHLQRVLCSVKEKGARVLLALNPATPVEVAADVLDDIDGLLIMTVNPGFAGQRMIPHSIDKIARARRYLDEHGRADMVIEVDGNVSVPNAILMKNAGANIFVAGTSAVFCGDSIEDNIRVFRREVFGEDEFGEGALR
ncbi:MAG: ribulose-phosphate 3-epimerase [Clostridia bacterium]|nr:ribulose-phosphate 3-epimerase [Clostridia bacterium]